MANYIGPPVRSPLDPGLLRYAPPVMPLARPLGPGVGFPGVAVPSPVMPPSYVPRAAPGPLPLPQAGRVIDQGPPRLPWAGTVIDQGPARIPPTAVFDRRLPHPRKRRAAMLALAQFGHHYR